MFPMPEKLQNHSNEGKLRKREKERTRRRKGGEKKAITKKSKRSIGDKNPARYIYMFFFSIN